MDLSISPGTLVLTKNSRLARWLLLQYNQNQIQNQQVVWETPSIMTLDAWLRETWIQSNPKKFILSELQSQKLWETIIRDKLAGSSLDLLHLRGSAKLASQAFNLIQEYGLPVESKDYIWTEETESFHGWLTAYEKELQSAEALDPSQLLRVVQEGMIRGTIPVPARIVFAGFDEIHPQMQSWLDYLTERNISIQLYPEIEEQESLQQLDKNPLPSIIVKSFTDQRQECIQCARWVRSVYQPGEKIGILAPNLEDYRTILTQELKAELAPESIYPWEEAHLPFNVSLGRPLGHESMIHQALDFLSWDAPTIPTKSFVSLLTSGFVKGNDEENALRLSWERKLLNRGPITVELRSFRKSITREGDSSLGKIIHHILDWIVDGSFNFPSQWAKNISAFLVRIGWPAGNQTPNSTQFQILDAWHECLDEMSTLDSVLGKIGRLNAVETLSNIISNKIFQPKTREEPIQVAGLLDTAGMNFDHVWILGLQSENFPPPPSPNPFIPFNLQKQNSLPHSTAEHELDYSERVLYRRLFHVKNAILSYPQMDQDMELLPSPFLRFFSPNTSNTESEVSYRVIDHFSQKDLLENYEELYQLPLHPLEKDQLKGGYQLIKNQAQCPFRAFALNRLNAGTREFPEIDLDASHRGTLLHNILELFWKKVKTSDTLHDLAQAGGLLKFIEDCAEETLSAYRSLFSQQSQFREMEKNRLARLVEEWIHLELERSPFQVNLVEEDIVLDLAGLSLKLQVDRMDQIPDGGRVIIDYKTSNSKPEGKWFDPRIQEPQLPLYNLKYPADAVSFAWVKKGSCSFIGLEKQKGLLPGMKSPSKQNIDGFNTWDETQHHWTTRLTDLAQQFMEGQIAVDPFHSTLSCQYCNLETLCRKSEILGTQNEESS